MTATPEQVDDLDQRIGESVHTMLFRRRMTQRQLAAGLGVSPSVLSKKLRGEVTWSARDVLAAAQLLGVTVGELYGDVPSLPSLPPPTNGAPVGPPGLEPGTYGLVVPTSMPFTGVAA